MKHKTLSGECKSDHMQIMARLNKSQFHKNLNAGHLNVCRTVYAMCSHKLDPPIYSLGTQFTQITCSIVFSLQQFLIAFDLYNFSMDGEMERRGLGDRIKNLSAST